VLRGGSSGETYGYALIDKRFRKLSTVRIILLLSQEPQPL